MYDPKRDYQNHKSEYDQAIQQVLNHGRFINGDEIVELEKRLAEYVSVKHCICVSNGTDALKIALLALGVGWGDEVITVAHSWISTVEVISLIGATPVFVDIEDATFNLDPKLLESKITEKTRAIIPVSLYGQMADLPLINQIAERYGLYVIEDGAQSFGASIMEQKSCSMTDIATTSFFPSKPLGCYGDGGACFTNSDDLALKIRAIKSHGGIKRFEHKYIGMNARLDTLQAAILLVKLRYFDAALARRNQIADYYVNQLKQIDGIRLPKTLGGNFHVWAQFSIVVQDKAVRDGLFEHLKRNGIGVAIFYPSPLHTQECFSYLEYKRGDLPITERICDTVINLPLYAELTNEEIDKIVNTVILYF